MKSVKNQESINSKGKRPHHRHYFLLTSTKLRENKIITTAKREIKIDRTSKDETESKPDKTGRPV